MAESLDKSTDEMKDKKIPESYSEKYEKKEAEPTMDVKSFVDSLFKTSAEENKALKVTSQADKKSKKVLGKIIDIADDSFELDL